MDKHICPACGSNDTRVYKPAFNLAPVLLVSLVLIIPIIFTGGLLMLFLLPLGFINTNSLIIKCNKCKYHKMLKRTRSII